jgi:hypothetical protein
MPEDCWRVRGERHGMSKLTEQQAREIFWLTHETSRFMREIAECFGITKSSVQSIKERRNWKWLTQTTGE